MHRELRALLRNKTWEYIRRSDIPQGHKILTGRWIWVYKRDGTRKSRRVVRGFEQVEGIDYQETFAAVARAESYRILLAIAKPQTTWASRLSVTRLLGHLKSTNQDTAKTY
jgi:hypothetical protein